MTLKGMIFKGLCNGFVRIIENPNDDCIACKIGEYWFYFIGNEYEDLTPDEVYETFTKDELTEMILNAMESLDKTEKDYYKAYLAEQFELLENMRGQSNMEERLEALYKEVETLLNLAPIEDDCTDEENAMYFDMEHLKESMFDAGYGR